MRRGLSLALCVVGIAYGVCAHAQSAPFTIRRPPDGATVREQVRVEIPGASVQPGDMIEILIDGKFVEALPAVDETTPHAAGAPFTFVWDTKGGDAAGQEIPDGDHTFKAVLYAPVGGSDAMSVKAESEVKITVQNKIHTDTGPIRLQYRFRDGDSVKYARAGRAYIVGSLSGLSNAEDRVLATVDSQLQLAIEDVRSDSSLVRNKLVRLDVEQNGQARSFDPRELPDSVYEEIDSQGRVVYAPAGALLAAFDELGLAVQTTVDLPVLPIQPVSVGSTWTELLKIDVPGTLPANRPSLTIKNTFEDLEWDNGYPTAKIRQSVEAQAPVTVAFGPLDVKNPKLSFERNIYLAYRSGRLIRTVETLTVSGETNAVLEQPLTGGARGGGLLGAGSAPTGPPGLGGRAPMGQRGGGYTPAGVGIGGGRRGGLMGGMRPGGAAGGGPPLGGGRGLGPGRVPGAGPAGGMGMGRVGGTLPIGETSHPVVLKSTMVTTLIPDSVKAMASK
jgi:hypothetical protein